MTEPGDNLFQGIEDEKAASVVAGQLVRDADWFVVILPPSQPGLDVDIRVKGFAFTPSGQLALANLLGTAALEVQMSAASMLNPNKGGLGHDGADPTGNPHSDN